jgi:putative peptidoglycan lipid II flippase
MVKETAYMHSQPLQKTEHAKKSVIAKTMQVGASTLMSRLLGLAREFLMSKFLGVGEMADAFITAFKIPNSLRKIFAEGALSAACIPTFVSVIKKESQEEASALMTLSFLTFEGLLIALCGLIFWQAEWVVRLIAPGWFLTPAAVVYHSTVPVIGTLMEWFAPAWYVITPLSAQGIHAISFLRLLIAFIVFLSSSALLAGALQSVNHFFVPAVGPVLLNVVFIGGLVACLKFGLSVEWLCFFILCGGFLQFILHLGVYFQLNFNFAVPTRNSWRSYKNIMIKFLPCLVSMSILELNLFMSTSLATYLPKGSIALLYYANRFMGIPLGVLIGAFSTILLPYFSRISTYAPQRLGFYLFEAAKIVFWITIPCTFIMSFLSEKIFHTIFLSEKFSLIHVEQAALLLTIFLSGLFFFSLYKILLNIYYALHDTKTPCYISLVVLALNYGLCKLFLPSFGVNGLAMAFVVTNSIHVALFALFLYVKFNFRFYFKQFFTFAFSALMQIGVAVAFFISAYQICHFLIQHFFHPTLINLLLFKIGFWLWVSPLCGVTIMILIKTRKLFNVHLYFLD